jgi:hypothetical protein
MKKGMCGTIIKEIGVCSEEKVASNGNSISMDEGFLDRGDFVIEEVLEDKIAIKAKGDNTLWYVQKEDFVNLKFD